MGDRLNKVAMGSGERARVVPGLGYRKATEGSFRRDVSAAGRSFVEHPAGNWIFCRTRRASAIAGLR